MHGWMDEWLDGWMDNRTHWRRRKRNMMKKLTNKTKIQNMETVEKRKSHFSSYTINLNLQSLSSRSINKKNRFIRWIPYSYLFFQVILFGLVTSWGLYDMRVMHLGNFSSIWATNSTCLASRLSSAFLRTPSMSPIARPT
jgi:hypothetical protein